jgi:hypothetical protein
VDLSIIDFTINLNHLTTHNANHIHILATDLHAIHRTMDQLSLSAIFSPYRPTTTFAGPSIPTGSLSTGTRPATPLRYKAPPLRQLQQVGFPPTSQINVRLHATVSQDPRTGRIPPPHFLVLHQLPMRKLPNSMKGTLSIPRAFIATASPSCFWNACKTL